MVGKLTKNGQNHALFELLNRVALKESEFPARRVLREPSVAGGDEVMLIRSGLAWLYRVASGGDLQVVALRFPGEPVLPDELNSGYGVQAIVESRVAAAKTRDLHSSSEGSASEILLPIVERQHRIALQWLVRGTFEATGKVAHLLCEMAVRSGQGQKHDTPISIPLTQQQIGAITGQTPINVNRILNGLQREGVLQRTGRQYTADWSALRQLGRFDPAYLLQVDINSSFGRLLVMLGFFAFIGAVAGALVVGRAAQEQYRRGESNMNPLVCTVAAFVALLLLTAVLASVK